MKYKAIRNYISYEDLIEKAGYKTYTPKIGVLGKLLRKAVSKSRCLLAGQIKKQLDTYFDNTRQHKRKKDNNGKKERHNKRDALLPNVISA